MRLLFDQNLSHRLVDLLVDLFPGSTHVRDAGLGTADDNEVWEHAKAHGLVIVSKDADFRQLSFLQGHPPKVIWLNVGNRSTAELHELVRRHAAALGEFAADPDASLLVLTDVRA